MCKVIETHIIRSRIVSQGQAPIINKYSGKLYIIDQSRIGILFDLWKVAISLHRVLHIKLVVAEASFGSFVICGYTSQIYISLYTTRSGTELFGVNTIFAEEISSSFVCGNVRIIEDRFSLLEEAICLGSKLITLLTSAP